MKKAVTYTLIVGGKECTYNCPFCVSKMTPDYGLGYDEPKVNWKNFDEAAKIAKSYGANNVLLTGKGEPLLYKAQMTEYLHRLERHSFNRTEVQTNGSVIAYGGKDMDDFLRIWYDHGLTTVALSIYHYDKYKNERLFRPRGNKEYFDLPKVIEQIHSHDLETRLSCCMTNGGVDSVSEVEQLVQFAKENGVFQVTLRELGKPSNPEDKKAEAWVDRLRLSDDKHKEISDYLQKNGVLCDVMPFGGYVYELDGQNVCITTCLTKDGGEDEIRHLIFFPSGLLTTSWENIMGSAIRQGWTK
ncbi:MAG: radical SAM protein [Nanoarchaeota archaeon]|nr:radical SAM protein [Nanoarchaeota archaeon]